MKKKAFSLATIPSPCFVLEEEKLIQNLELMQSVQERAGVDIILALKGFAMWSVFPLIRQYLKGATASSYYEAKLIMEHMGVRAHTYAPVYFPKDFHHIANSSEHITFNSLKQFHRFFKKLEDHNSVGLRVNPEYSPVKIDLYNPAGEGSRLGETIETIGDHLPSRIEGLHVHTLCESDAESTGLLLEAVEAKFGKFFPQLKWINLGGGHLMTRQGYNVNQLVDILRNFKNKYPQLQVILEPGSAVAWQTGFLRSKVMDIHQAHDIKTAALDVSFTAHMPDTLEMPYRPEVRNASSKPKKNQYLYRLGGTSCLAGDFMEVYGFDAPLKVGHDIILEDMMHYTMVKTTTFNGVAHPSIGIIDRHGQFRVVRRFTYKDYRNRLS